MNYHILNEQISAAVRACGEIILHADRSEIGITDKAGSANFVTKYDKMVQNALEEKLLEILPEAVFVGEEEDIHASIEHGYAFIVDPIDGTTNFIKDAHCSAISVGVTLEGQPVMGVIYNPYLNEMYTAIRDCGAYMNGSPIHVSDAPLERGLVLFGTSPYYEELSGQSFKQAKAYFDQAMDIRRSGSAAIDLCSIAAGRAELFFELLLSPWDYAAGSLIVTEAGGRITQMDGSPITLDHGCSIRACNAVIAQQL